MGYHKEAVLAQSGDVHAPAANTAAVVTIAAQAGVETLIHAIHASYSPTPSGGNLKVKRASTVVRDIDITASGPYQVLFDPPIKGAANEALTVELAAGGVGVVGKVNVTYSSHRVS